MSQEADILQNEVPPLFDFTGKVALITGAAGDVGRASALSFSRAGAAVVAVDIDPAGKVTADMIERNGGRALFAQASVCAADDVSNVVKQARNTFGRIDFLLNIAAIEGVLRSTAEYDEADFDRVMEVNCKGVFLCMRYVLPEMLAQKSGSVVNVASTAGLIGSPMQPAYSAAKHAVVGLSRTAAGEVGRSGIRVNALCPGPIEGRMIRALERQSNPEDPAAAARRYLRTSPIGRYALPMEIAATAMFLCSPLAAAVNGAAWTIDGGRTTTSPGLRDGATS
jgi:NAD(P)-dependent dehydrogenase (short-subunit alcohol dehydrogenase family)